MKQFIQCLPPVWEDIMNEDTPTSLPANYEQESRGFLAFEGLFDGRLFVGGVSNTFVNRNGVLIDIDIPKTEHVCSNQEEKKRSVQRIVQIYNMILNDCACSFQERFVEAPSASNHSDEKPSGEEFPDEKRRKVE